MKCFALTTKRILVLADAQKKEEIFRTARIWYACLKSIDIDQNEF